MLIGDIVINESTGDFFVRSIETIEAFGLLKKD